MTEKQRLEPWPARYSRRKGKVHAACWEEEADEKAALLEEVLSIRAQIRGRAATLRRRRERSRRISGAAVDHETSAGGLVAGPKALEYQAQHHEERARDFQRDLARCSDVRGFRALVARWRPVAGWKTEGEARDAREANRLNDLRILLDGEDGRMLARWALDVAAGRKVDLAKIRARLRRETLRRVALASGVSVTRVLEVLDDDRITPKAPGAAFKGGAAKRAALASSLLSETKASTLAQRGARARKSR